MMRDNFWREPVPFPSNISDDVIKWLLYIRYLDDTLHGSKNTEEIEFEGLKTTASISSSIYNLKRKLEYVQVD